VIVMSDSPAASNRIAGSTFSSVRLEHASLCASPCESGCCSTKTKKKRETEREREIKQIIEKRDHRLLRNHASLGLFFKLLSV